MITVAKYIANFLKTHGINHIFGFQGSAMLKMLDEIIEENIEYIQNFNEQASGFGADAYARLNGIGAAIATSGPGAVNLIGGIANAYFDSVPVIFITGQDYLSNISANNNARQNGFQDMDIVSMVKPITKYSVLLDKPENVRYELEKAYYYATSGRKGPVLIDVPIDIQFKEIEETILNSFNPPEKPKYNFKIEEIIKLLKQSSKPLIIAGGGIRGANAVEEFNEFISKTNIPFVSTLNGYDSSVKKIGFSGIFGNTESGLATLNADLLIVLGARFAQQHTGRRWKDYANENVKIIHVDIDGNEINRIISEDISVKADLKEFLSELNKIDFCLQISDWINEINTWKLKYKDTIKTAKKGINPVELIRELEKYTKNDTVFTSDVGANQMWVAQALHLKSNQRLLNSAGFGAMGYSLPAAIGVSYLASEIISFMGDGGLQMNLQELNTLSLRRNNIKCFVFNNNHLGLMRNLQKNFYNNHFYGNNEREFTCPNLKKLADTFNLDYLKIETEKDFPKLKNIFEKTEPYIIDVIIDKNTMPLNRYDDEVLKNA